MKNLENSSFKGKLVVHLFTTSAHNTRMNHKYVDSWVGDNSIHIPKWSFSNGGPEKWTPAKWSLFYHELMHAYSDIVEPEIDGFAISYGVSLFDYLSGNAEEEVYGVVVQDIIWKSLKENAPTQDLFYEHNDWYFVVSADTYEDLYQIVFGQNRER